MTISLRKPAPAWVLVTLLLLPALTHAETAVQAWVQRYSRPGGGDASATAMAVDGGNNVIVTGYSLFIESSRDYATIKYSSAGLPLWTNRYDGHVGPYTDEPVALAVDSSNNLIVTGSSGLIAGVDTDYATLKYSSAGVPLWTNRYNGYGLVYSYDDPKAVAVDGSNNVIVTGTSASNAGSYDYATIKYSGAGVPLWTNRYNGPANGSDVAAAMAVDGSNNMIVTGTSAVSGGMSDYATIKYSSDGMPLWTNCYHGPGNSRDYASAVAVDSSNNVIVTGYSTGSGSGYDYATIKYASDGVPLWTNRYNGAGNCNDIPTAIAVDGSNNVIVTGTNYATIKYSSEGVSLWTNRYGGSTACAVAADGKNNVIVTGLIYDGSQGFHDYATVKYSSDGVPLWTNRYNGPANADDMATAMALDHSGNVIVTGYSADTRTYPYYYDYATIKYVSQVPLPVLTSLQLTNGTFQMRVDDVLQPGTLVIEASADLSANPPDWSPVFTNTTPTNVLFYTDSEAGGYPKRFYRALQIP